MALPFAGFEQAQCIASSAPTRKRKHDEDATQTEPAFVSTPFTRVLPACACNSTLNTTYDVTISNLPADYTSQPWFVNLTLHPIVSSVCPQKPKPLVLWRLNGTTLHLPKFAGLLHLGHPSNDQRSHGNAMQPHVAFAGKLCAENPPQQQATDATLLQLQSLGGALLVLPCGFGKTVCSLYVAVTIHRRSLIVVHSEALAAQWVDRITAFVPHASVGKIQQDVVDVDGRDIVVCMIQSLIKRDYDATVLRSFGMVIVDEAHHVAAPMFSQALGKLSARFILALSATPDRPDGCGAALNALMGPTAFRAKRVHEHVDVRMVTYTRGDTEELVSKYNGKPLASTMLTRLATDFVRCQLVADLVMEQAHCQGNILVLSDRLDQLAMLQEMLADIVADGHTVARVVGGTKAQDRVTGFDATVILSTYHYASEGIDIPRLDTLVMATPRGNVEQTVGRILRPFPNKKTPLVIDVKDPFSLFEGMAWKRFRYYKSQAYRVTRVDDVGGGADDGECAESQE